jgi:hypothetical protein
MLTKISYLIAPYGATFNISGLYFFALLYHKQDIFRDFYTRKDLQPQERTQLLLVFS